MYSAIRPGKPKKKIPTSPMKSPMQFAETNGKAANPTGSGHDAALRYRPTIGKPILNVNTTIKKAKGDFSNLVIIL